MDVQKFGPFPVTLPAAKHWDSATKSFTVELPEEHGYVTIEVDIAQLVLAFGRRALINKSGVAVEAGGAIKLRRVKR